MRKEDVIRSIILAIIIIFIAANINGINSFLSVHTDRTIDFGHSETVVPQAWNTTEELNLTNHSKTPILLLQSNDTIKTINGNLTVKAHAH